MLLTTGWLLVLVNTVVKALVMMKEKERKPSVSRRRLYFDVFDWSSALSVIHECTAAKPFVRKAFSGGMETER